MPQALSKMAVQDPSLSNLRGQYARKVLISLGFQVQRGLGTVHEDTPRMHKPANPDTNPQLARHLAWVVVIKLVVITGLWWAFVKGQHVTVDADHAAPPWVTVPANHATSQPSDSHDQ